MRPVTRGGTKLLCPVSTAVIFGLTGPRLSAEEAAFFARVQPWGFILFRRNIETPDQVRSLCEALRGCIDRADAPILIDQEGGRVQRMGPPHWRRFPPARAYGRLESEAGCELARLGARLIADDLAAAGITVDCMPVLDVPAAVAHDAIGDRAYGDDPERVTTLGRAVCEGLLTGSVLPVIKHMPGHGRAIADSHHKLPVIGASHAELERDFLPFKALADMPMAMTAHVVFSAIDPDHPATLSPRLIERVIRGSIGFDGLLMSDDLSMSALAGDIGGRARACLAAGCDVALHCNGEMAEMVAVAAAARPLSSLSARRAEVALRRRPVAEPFDAHAAWSRIEYALAGVAA